MRVRKRDISHPVVKARSIGHMSSAARNCRQAFFYGESIPRGTTVQAGRISISSIRMTRSHSSFAPSCAVWPESLHHHSAIREDIINMHCDLADVAECGAAPAAGHDT